MRSPARLVNGTAAAALAVAALGLSTAASPAYAGDLGALEISPATAAPGTTVVVNTTACGSGAKAVGHANSLEAGQFTLAPATGRQALVGTFRVPEAADAGPYSIGVSCDNGKEAAGALAVRAADTGQAGGQVTEKVGGQDDAPGDDQGGGGKIPSLDSLLTGNGNPFGNENPLSGLDSLSTDETILGRQSSPEDDSPTGRDNGSGSGRENGSGSGRENGNESGRDNGSGSGRDNGNESGRDDGGRADGGRDTGLDEGGRDDGGDGLGSPLEPSGHVKTGVGGSVRPDTTQIAAGAGVLAVSAVGGAWLLRRRASGTQAGN
ncbi:hypothetical protein LRD69_09275 [Streptomyces sp. JH14]|uniref:hypothetical protein n=1 Tax=Streptomyces sp. JH14 TaxID=2793630 RepID=UPI0023F7FD92|nr:hypothetical protein [Streptomyces sp. JH14]MDF6042349.1 hypothetical protein [Streptomyces sp. JH14]